MKTENTPMETLQDVQEDEETSQWSSMAKNVVEEDETVVVEHVNSEEPQRTALNTPGDHVPVPDEIEMMNNGVSFSRTKDS